MAGLADWGPIAQVPVILTICRCQTGRTSHDSRLADPGRAGVARGAGVAVIAGTVVGQVLATLDGVAGIGCADVLVVAIKRNSGTNARLALIDAGARAAVVADGRVGDWAGQAFAARCVTKRHGASRFLVRVAHDDGRRIDHALSRGADRGAVAQIAVVLAVSGDLARATTRSYALSSRTDVRRRAGISVIAGRDGQVVVTAQGRVAAIVGANIAIVATGDNARQTHAVFARVADGAGCPVIANGGCGGVRHGAGSCRYLASVCLASVILRCIANHDRAGLGLASARNASVNTVALVAVVGAVFVHDARTAILPAAALTICIAFFAGCTVVTVIAGARERRRVRATAGQAHVLGARVAVVATVELGTDADAPLATTAGCTGSGLVAAAAVDERIVLTLSRLRIASDDNARIIARGAGHILAVAHTRPGLADEPTVAGVAVVKCHAILRRLALTGVESTLARAGAADVAERTRVAVVTGHACCGIPRRIDAAEQGIAKILRTILTIAAD